jgi:hypothetical protein
MALMPITFILYIILSFLMFETRDRIYVDIRFWLICFGAILLSPFSTGLILGAVVVFAFEAVMGWVGDA